MRLAQVLLQRSLLTVDQFRSIPGAENMEEAQLGSALVDAGVLTTDQLALALSELSGVPPALEVDFQRSDPILRKRLRAHQASSLKCIPLYSSKNRRVAVAMVDPGHPKAIDELAFVLGACIEPMVTSEPALARHLELLYAMPRRKTTGFNPVAVMGSTDGPGVPSRKTTGFNPVAVTSPVDEIVAPCVPEPNEDNRRVRLSPLTPIPQSVRPHDPIPVLRIATPPARSRAKKETQSYLAAVQDMPLFVPSDPNAPNQAAAEPQTPIPPMVAVTGPDRAVELILSSPDRQAAADNLFAFMRSCFGAGAMFVVGGGCASGRFGYSEGMECPAVESLRLSLSLPSCFHIAHNKNAIFHGAPPPEGEAIHGSLWAALRCPPPKEVLVAPVVAAGQVSLMLYAHGRKHGRIERASVARMEHVCSALADTLVRLAG
jgi:hypothetical protein